MPEPYRRPDGEAVLDHGLRAAALNAGKRSHRAGKNGKAWVDRLTDKAVWRIFRNYARKAGIEK